MGSALFRHFLWCFSSRYSMNGQHNWLSTDWSGYMVFLIVVAEDSIFLRSRELGISFFSLV